MLIIALVLAVIGLAALVFAVVTSNALVAWVCIAASVLGVVLLIIDALQERRRRAADSRAGEPVAAKADAQRTAESTGGSGTGAAGSVHEGAYEDYPEDAAEQGGGGQVSSRRAESGAGASEEPGGSDEYDHDHGAVGDDNSR